MYHSNNLYILGASLILVCLFPIFGLAAPCDAPSGLSSWSSTYGTTLTSDIVVSKPILVDVSAITAQGITITQGGMLYFDRTKPSISLTANFILITSGGSLHIGTEACPYTQKATITLAGSMAVVNEHFGANFIGVAAGGILELHGAKALESSWTKLTQTALAGATSIKVLDSVNGWQAGDKIVIATTDYSPLQSEVVTVTSVGGNTISFVPALQYDHYGLITQNVDERAEVGLLTRNILIQGKIQTQYFGGHLMIMRGFTRARIEGVEFYNMGQDQIARYPIHFHLCNTVPDGTYVKYNSIHDTNFRCVTIHATNGVLIEGNVAYKSIGHCYFLEDGVEENNIFRNNLAILTEPKDFGQKIGSDASNTGLSSYWITNPNNVFEGNVAAGSHTAGFWIITRHGARGVAACIPEFQNLRKMISNTPLLSFSGNSAHSCETGLGIESTFWDSGDVPAQTCDTPLSNWEPRNPDGTLAWSYFDSFTAHHNRGKGVWARMPNIVIEAGRFADNYESLEFATSGDHPPYASQQIVQNCIVIGVSDNKGNKNEPTTKWQVWDANLKASIPTIAVATPINGIKMYDGPQVIVNTVFQSFPSTPGRPADAPLGARIADRSQVATTNYMQSLQFIGVGTRYSVIDDSMDGGIAASLRDTDGSVTGYKGATALRNLPYYKTDNCVASNSFMLACPHKYSQLWVLDMTANGNNNKMFITRSHRPAGSDPSLYTLPFEGFVAGSLWRYQPIVSIGSSYLVRFQSRVPPSLVLQLNNAEQSESVSVAVCYPQGAVIQSVNRGYSGYRGNTFPINEAQAQLSPISSVGAIGSTTGSSYYYDAARSILYVNVQQRNVRTEYGSFCPPQGCDLLWINAHFPVTGAARDCTADAYASGLLVTGSEWLNQKLVTAPRSPSVLGSLLSGLLQVPSTVPIRASTTAPTRKPSSPSSPTTAPTTAPAGPTAAPTRAPAVPTAAPVGPTAAPTRAPAGPTAAPVGPTAVPTAPATTAECTARCNGFGCCGAQCYDVNVYNCYNNNLLCMKGFLGCGMACYDPTKFTCVNGELRN